MDKPGIVGKTILEAGRFVALKSIDWTDAEGVVRKWESAERVGNTSAVMIIPRLQPSGRILLIRQFRPPVGREVIEFPAGLVNPDEDPAEAGLRELKEETGYTGTVTRISPAVFSSPGLTNEAVHIAEVTIDEYAPENIDPITALEATEMIESFFVPYPELGDFYRRETLKGTAFDAKVAMYLLTLTRGK